MAAIIGSLTTYTGHEMPELKGRKVLIVGVLKRALCDDVDVHAYDFYVNDETQLTRLGGVTAHDRIDVQPIVVSGDASFIHLDPRAIDLEAFAYLKKNSKKRNRR